ncbi:response regulator transcription factor [Amylibacter sp.]|jgi:two-component system phosphate regulon response regulator OmpR|nr:response regulator transcription factor [Amylibacter sp.]MDB3878544.1 response regulator transcription factor [Amylibacter sp.]MDB4190661.1 response regulator transcription factor [Amylibacter sp.]MDB9740207.1 response regulator transcription factor [Amylibacter sp.]MDB9850800.1 response regulator transcription factor [Amylibacter sp.]|tara:strand:- start:1147 stop:1854 length:708 start_codon:yes stop_codon:yes gene_type:complete
MNIINNPAHILIVDDDERIRNLLQKFLLRNGFFASIARDAAHARRLLSSIEFDMIVLDVMMPGEDGLSLTIDLRKTLTTPILLLTAKSESNERIMGFEAGADDYLTKPFEPKELVLRINSILRRMPKDDVDLALPTTIQMGAVRYDLSRGELWDNNALVKLTATESALLRIFSVNLHNPVSRPKLVEDLTKNGVPSQERSVDVQITRLRRKLEVDPKMPRYLQTVRGAGYMLAPD